MLHIVRNNSPFTVIILLVYALAINADVLLNPQLPQVPDGSFLYHILVGFFKVVLFNSAFGFTILAVLMHFLQAVYLNSIVIKHKAFVQSNYVPAFVYLSVVALYPPFSYFSQPLITNWFLILILDIVLRLGHTNSPKKYIFNAGCIIALAGLIHFTAVFYLLLLIISVRLMRNMNLVEWLIGVLGFATTIYFAAGMLFLFDVLHWIPLWAKFGVNLPSNIQNPLYVIGMLSGIIILFIMGVYMLQSGINRVNVFIRRGWTSVGIYLFISSIVALLTDIEVVEAWLLIMPPLALFIANVFNAEKRKAFSNFAFYFTLLLVAFCKFTYGI